MVPVPLDSRSQSHIEQALHHCQIRKTVWFENADKTIFRFCFSLSFDKLFHVQCDVRPTLTSLDLFAMLCTHLQMHIFLFSSYNHIKFVLFIYSFFFSAIWEESKFRNGKWWSVMEKTENMEIMCLVIVTHQQRRVRGRRVARRVSDRQTHETVVCLVHTSKVMGKRNTHKTKTTTEKQWTQSAETRLLHMQKTIILLQDTMTSSHETSKIRLTA